MNTGKVYIVGAGPGDAGLITVKGEECLKHADVILYDRLVNPLLLEKAEENAERIYCGKLPDRHHLRQETIQELMIEKAKQGLYVVRLKGGDPGVFGRSGEETAALEETGIDYEIIPGISSGIAAPHYAGIPLTHRELSGSFAAITGHRSLDNSGASPDWNALVRAVDTLVFYMGVKNLPIIAEKLKEHGKPSHTPVMLIEWGTTGRQRVIEGTLSDICTKADNEQVQNPAITLVGDVCSLRSEPSWFEKKPLYSRYVWVVKTSMPPSRVGEMLQENGAEVHEAPRFAAVPSASLLPDNIQLYDSLSFLEADSVPVFFEALRKQKIDIRSLPEKIYAGTKRTQKKLEGYGIFPFLEKAPEQEYSLLIGTKESLPVRANHPVWISHRLHVNENTRKTTARLVKDDMINTIVLPCAKAVDTLLCELDGIGVSAVEWTNNRTVICYGPQTAQRAQAEGINVYSTLEKPKQEELLKSVASLG
ncbi:uroporphyrinogen-III C-methyltransferase [Alteribacillus persepolensis]|uniref:Uroporphyrinogen-III C-methyltransferase n=1 Tax=Alteribacillus persepolensis TaxID=568899 RepID=A0A1G8C9D9_9BACI|nr:uroporphyrinogen-III C-methyltransferase [Alteribacillus persepolensis]SDH41995.1 uroporphyrinogen-III C-methyltransferase [Alteribacillus persepolensis]